MNAAASQGWSADSDILNSVMRMVIPMRREFGRALDVTHFMHDLVYAKQIVIEAQSSQDEQLRERANLLASKLMGPRNSGVLPSRASSTPTPSSSSSPFAATPEPQPPEENEAALRAKMMSKYRSGLR